MSHQEEGQYQQRAFAVCGGRSLLARVHRQRRRAIDAGGDGSPCMKHTRRGFPRTRTNREIPLFLSPSEERVLACRDDALGSPNTLGILMHFLPWPPAWCQRLDEAASASCAQRVWEDSSRRPNPTASTSCFSFEYECTSTVRGFVLYGLRVEKKKVNSFLEQAFITYCTRGHK